MLEFIGIFKNIFKNCPVNLKILSYFVAILLFSNCLHGQNVSLYQQFNGKYDFYFFGNTLNLAENNGSPCVINTSASQTLNLPPEHTIVKAYLYWAGSGTGDFDVLLNDQPITAERQFSALHFISDRPYFSAFADVTSLVQNTGNGNYLLSELDVRRFALSSAYCNNRTNFAGWAIAIIYTNDALPLNQINIYDGLQSIPTEVNITLDNILIIDNHDAQIGFIAWEGDRDLADGERLVVNEYEVGNPPLNPVRNAFNGTNSFTGATDLYNMDLDVYNVEDYIRVADTTVNIKLTSNRDFVLISTIITKVNSILPDATIAIDSIALSCDSRVIVVDYTVSNLNSTKRLSPGIPISIYANDVLFAYDETVLPLSIGSSVSYQISLNIPDDIPNDFTLKIAVDDLGDGTGIEAEISETNNIAIANVSLRKSPQIHVLPELITCNQGLKSGTFDFSDYEAFVKEKPEDMVSFYLSDEDAENAINPILNTTSFYAQTTPITLFVRVDNEFCHTIASFDLKVKNCPPKVYNYISANNDNTNDRFFIEGLRDIFLNFKLDIYNRWGVLIWQGNNQMEDWDGKATKGMRFDNDFVPDGTYYYILHLNDPDYTSPMTGFLYLNH